MSRKSESVKIGRIEYTVLYPENDFYFSDIEIYYEKNGEKYGVNLKTDIIMPDNEIVDISYLDAKTIVIMATAISNSVKQTCSILED